MNGPHDKKLRFAVVGLDSSHSTELASRLIGAHPQSDQNLGVGQVVAAFPGGSGIGEVDQIQPRCETFSNWGAIIVDGLEDLLKFRLDGALITSIDGRVHLEQATPFIEASILTFIDKPLTCSPAEARKIRALAESHRAAVFSSSSVRFDAAVTVAQRGQALVTVDVYGPAPLEPTNPGLYWYGIHAVEMLYALMGRGCRQVCCCFGEQSEVVTAVWQDSRIATLRGLRTGCYAAGALCGTTRGVTHVVPNLGTMYFELAKRIAVFWQTGQAPVDLAETVEAIDFIDAAIRSAQQDGGWVRLSPD